MDDKRLDEILNEYVNSTSAGQNTDLKKYRNKEPKVLPARTNKNLALSICAVFLVIVIATPILIMLIAGPIVDNLFDNGIESGFSISNSEPSPMITCAVKSEKNAFDINDVTLTFYYGGDFPENLEFHIENGDHYPTFRTCFKNDDGDVYEIKHVQEEFVSEKYRIETEKKLFVNIKKYNFSEVLTIPKDLFTKDTGYVAFFIEGQNTNERLPEEFVRIASTQRIYYKVEKDTVYLSTKKPWPESTTKNSSVSDSKSSKSADTSKFDNSIEIPPAEVIIRPDTNLEFWLGDNVDGFDWSCYKEKYGLFGGSQYYGLGYEPIISEGGHQNDPEHCVIYTVTCYPDYSSKEHHVSSIYITDPSIYFNGISLNTPAEEIKEIMINDGFTIEEFTVGFTAEKGRLHYQFLEDYIRLRVEVTNVYNMLF